MSLKILAVAPKEMLELSTSPLILALQYVDPNIVSESFQAGCTALHVVAYWGDRSGGLVSQNQLTVGRQLIEAGANVNGRTNNKYRKCSPLHLACSTRNATNLDFIKLLLDSGADPNFRDSSGATPIMWTLPCSAGAAKFLLEYVGDDIDLNIMESPSSLSTRSGTSFLAQVRRAILNEREYIFIDAPKDHKEQAKSGYLIGQFRQLEEMLVARGALEIRSPAAELEYKDLMAKVQKYESN